MSLAKHFINDPTALVNSALRAITYTNPAVTLDEANKTVYLKPSAASPKNVAIVSGGGSGHEPSFASMVGHGLLTGAVAGTIFASPSAEQIRTAITQLAARAPSGDITTHPGILVTVMNYTGDVLSFGMAVEKARAAGVPVAMVVVGDDVGVGRARAGKVGRRGIAGTVLVHKISGALAARGASLDAVAGVAKLVTENLVSVGASLEHVHVPGRAADSADDGSLGADEVEIGMGIHNEPGSGRAKGLALPDLVRTMLKQLLDQTDKDRAFVDIPAGSPVVLLVNNLGGVSALELGGITAEVVDQLAGDYKLKSARVLSGAYMTSLNGLGFSISLLKLADTGLGAGGPSLLQLLDDPSEVTGWASPITAESWSSTAYASDPSTTTATAASANASSTTATTGASTLKADPAVFRAALESGLKSVIAAEPEITQYDTVVGDGDCGTGMKRGAEAVLEHLSSPTAVTGDVVADVAAIVPVIERSMDGTSGALYAIFLNALVHALRQQASAASSSTAPDWAAALRHSCDALSRYTPARPGDRTLVDALYPFVDKLAESGSPAHAAAASQAGAEHTKGMKASLGRTVYIGGSGFEKVPDPGAWGLSIFFAGLCK